MQQIPKGLNLDLLPGPKRGVSPAIYFRDEFVYSASGKHFALAYTITEVSMGNGVGCLLWGTVADHAATVLSNPEGIYTTCWYSPWATWLDETIFVFKAYHYCGQRLYLPLVAIDVNKGFAVVPKTNNADSRPSDVESVPTKFFTLSANSLADAILNEA